MTDLWGNHVQVRGCVNGGIGSLAVHMNNKAQKEWDALYKLELDFNSKVGMEPTDESTEAKMKMWHAVRNIDKEIRNIIARRFKEFSVASKTAEANRIISEMDIPGEKKSQLMTWMKDLLDLTSERKLQEARVVIDKFSKEDLKIMMDIGGSICTNESRNLFQLFSDVEDVGGWKVN